MVRDPAIAPGTGPVIVELEFAPQPEDRVSDILKTKKGSIRQAPLPSGSPSWSDLEAEDPTWAEVVANAKANKPGWKTFKKLLEQGRFNK